MLTIDDGTDLSPEDVAPIIVAPRRRRFRKSSAAGLWIVIVLIPLYWVFPRRLTMARYSLLVRLLQQTHIEYRGIGPQQGP